jgi:hypothetical protein
METVVLQTGKLMKWAVHEEVNANCIHQEPTNVNKKDELGIAVSLFNCSWHFP